MLTSKLEAQFVKVDLPCLDWSNCCEAVCLNEKPVVRVVDKYSSTFLSSGLYIIDPIFAYILQPARIRI